MAGDIGKPEDIARLFSELDKALGRTDILVNNAGIGARARPEEQSLEDWHHVIAVNMTGTHLCCVGAHRRMTRQGPGGSIVNTVPSLGVCRWAVAIPSAARPKRQSIR